MSTVTIRRMSSDLSREMKFEYWYEKIPYLTFPKGVEVKVLPNTGGAMSRFLIRLPEMSDKDSISIYLDCHSALGYYGDNEPYWEVYPSQNGDNFRCGMNEVDVLMTEIVETLDQWKNNNIHLTSPLGKAINGDSNDI